MDFQQLMQAVKKIQFETVRVSNGGGFEAVITKAHSDELIARLEDYFGLPVGLTQGEIPMPVRQAIDASGGIIAGQKLYYASEKDCFVFAMLWPWQDSLHTTVKIIKKQLVKDDD